MLANSALYNESMRILLFTGKGGVGKTSLAAATGVRLAQLNYRTLVMSIDPAHSLTDAFDLDTISFTCKPPIHCRSPTGFGSRSSTSRKRSSAIGRRSPL